MVVSQFTAYGAAVTGLPSGEPSRKNCTEATATLSDAFAATGMAPETVCPAVGLMMVTVGGVVSGGGGGGGGEPEPGTTSTAAKSYWSAVGAVSVRVTAWPAAVLGA